MEDKKVFKFLCTFSKRQLNRFEDYVSSPYFNKSEELCFIYEIVKKYILSNSSKSFQEYFIKQLPKNKNPLSASNLDKYLSRIFQFALDFVAMEQYKEEGFLKQNLLMNHLLRGDELKMFDKIYNRTKSTLNKEKLSYPNLLNRYLLERQKANYLSVNATSRKGKQNLQETSDALDTFYLAQKYNLELLKLSMETVINDKFSYYLIDIINNNLDDKFIENGRIFNFLQKAYNFIKYDSKKKVEIFEDLCTYLYENAHVIEEDIKFNFTIILRNEAWRLFGQKNKPYYEFIFNLNKTLIEKNLIYYNDGLFATLYKNIFDVAIRVNQLDWCNTFIETNKNKIIPVLQAPDIINYSKARLKFYSKNYKETIDFIKNLNFTDLYYKLAVRRLEIMVFFELKEYLHLESLINAFRVTLTPQRSTNLHKQHRKINKNFISCVTKLIKINQSASEVKKKYSFELKKDLNDTSIPHQIWLSKKIKEAVL